MPRRDLAQTLLSMVCLGALIVAAFWIVRPFIAATIWATTIVVVTWPLLLRIEKRLWNSRWLSITAMLVILLILFMVPLALLVGTLLSNADQIAFEFNSLLAFRMPTPPDWLVGLPVVGARLASLWHDTAAAGAEGLWARLAPYAGTVTGWLVARAGGVGYLSLQYLLTLILAAFIYANGEEAAFAAKRLGRRLGGRSGEDLVHLAGQATRAVAIGVGVTALVQSILGGIGLALAGVPFALLLTAVLFMLCIAQIGMLVVLIPAVAWVYWSGHPWIGTVLLVWSLVVSLIDNVLRPLLVRRSADVP
ncbi:MAG TPA: AI-2E family transporter YdiK, partial [Caldimonas sp.]|nr:AI-2E family transporter YdiK [Caldimonas sp.]